jgi:hypothetical protein
MAHRISVRLAGSLLLLVFAFMTGGATKASACCACGPQFCQGACYTQCGSDSACTDACFQGCFEQEMFCISNCVGEIC